MDELGALTRTQREYRECSVMCFTETWLHEHIPDSNATVPGFQMVRADRDRGLSGKKRGGGIAVLVNNRWSNPGHITVKEHFCSPDIELLVVSMCPYYLPREFTCAIIIVYIPPSADAACDVITSVTARLQTDHPNAFMAISSDFNHTTLSATLPTFQQFVTCHTRGNKTLDLMYANVEEAYNSTVLPLLGRSDHNLVLLTSRYTPIVQKQPVITRTVRRWSQEADGSLQGCFEATDWDVLCEPHGEDLALQWRTFYVFPNEKRQQKIQRERLMNDFSAALNNFQAVQRRAAEKEKESIARARAGSRLSTEDSSRDEKLVSFDNQEDWSQITTQTEEAFTEEDLELIKERETNIRQLESDIMDVNQIFKDLAVMIHDQGEMIDSIEANVENAEVHVERGTEQLQRAAYYQQKSRKKMCILAMVCSIMLVILGIIIWQAAK